MDARHLCMPRYNMLSFVGLLYDEQILFLPNLSRSPSSCVVCVVRFSFDFCALCVCSGLLDAVVGDNNNCDFLGPRVSSGSVHYGWWVGWACWLVSWAWGEIDGCQGVRGDCASSLLWGYCVWFITSWWAFLSGLIEFIVLVESWWMNGGRLIRCVWNACVQITAIIWRNVNAYG